jgi:hypothetical protein
LISQFGATQATPAIPAAPAHARRFIFGLRDVLVSHSSVQTIDSTPCLLYMQRAANILNYYANFSNTTESLSRLVAFYTAHDVRVECIYVMCCAVVYFIKIDDVC